MNKLQIEAFVDDTSDSWHSLTIARLDDERYFDLSIEHIDLVKDSINGTTPSKKNRWHLMTLQFIEATDHPEHYHMIDCYLVPILCISCNKELGEDGVSELDKHGIEYLCSQYCAEKLNGNC